MARGTGIEWATATWNPIVGCTKVSAGCQNCYAMRSVARVASVARARKLSGQPLTPKLQAASEVVRYGPTGLALPIWNNEVRMIRAALDEPMRWRKAQQIFINAESDLFHPLLTLDEISEVLARVVCCPRHRFICLTKRPEILDRLIHGGALLARVIEIARWIIDDPTGARRSILRQTPEAHWNDLRRRLVDRSIFPLPNLLLGPSVEDHQTAVERFRYLPACLQIARTSVVSYEPAIGRIYWDGLAKLDPQIPRRIGWIICGGESGRGARTLNIDWIDETIAFGHHHRIPIMVKQLGAMPRCRHADPFGEWTQQTDGSCQTCQFRPPSDDPKGGDVDQWPRGLRVRQEPEYPDGLGQILRRPALEGAGC